MIFECDIRKHLKKCHINIDSKSGISIHGASKTAAAYLIKQALAKQASVVIYGKNPDYYPLIKEYEPYSIGTFDAKYLKQSLKWPWIENLKDKTLYDMENCITEANMTHDLINLMSKDRKTLIKDPNMVQSFYQIKNEGKRKERVLTEILLTAMLLQGVYSEPVREVCFFIDAPFRPFTKVTLEAVKEAEEYDIPVICIYPDSGKNYDRAGCSFSETKNSLLLRQQKRVYTVIDKDTP